MKTEAARKFLEEWQIGKDETVWDKKEVEHPLCCLLEEYHQAKLKSIRNKMKHKKKWYKVQSIPEKVPETDEYCAYSCDFPNCTKQDCAAKHPR